MGDRHEPEREGLKYMAYNANNLSVLAHNNNGFTLWHYVTTDTGAAVDAGGYFNKAAKKLRSGDMIMANVDAAGSLRSGILTVTAIEDDRVDVHRMTC